jgi:predicted RNA-binding Zn-ribbon protein involved in translation (DUF1610 family)
MDNKAPTTLMQAVTAHLNTLGREKRGQAGPALLHLARWFGGEKALRALSPADVERYRTQLAQHGDSTERLEPLRDFFSFVEREGMTEGNLAAALRIRPSSRSTGARSTPARSKKPPSARAAAFPGEAASPQETAEQPAGAPAQDVAPGRATDSGERAAIRCPSCGEREALRGERRSDAIVVTCRRCGHVWQRTSQPVCPRCGRADLVATSEPLVERVRGNQTAIVGARTVYRCPDCDI